MQITDKIKKAMCARMGFNHDHEFTWSGNWQHGIPVITIDGVIHDARDVAYFMGHENIHRKKSHGDMEQQADSGDH